MSTNNSLDDHSGRDERQNSEKNDEHENSGADWGTDVELVVDAVASEGGLDQFASVASTALPRRCQYCTHSIGSLQRVRTGHNKLAGSPERMLKAISWS